MDLENGSSRYWESVSVPDLQQGLSYAVDLDLGTIKCYALLCCQALNSCSPRLPHVGISDILWDELIDADRQLSHQSDGPSGRNLGDQFLPDTYISRHSLIVLGKIKWLAVGVVIVEHDGQICQIAHPKPAQRVIQGLPGVAIRNLGMLAVASTLGLIPAERIMRGHKTWKCTQLGHSVLILLS